MINPGSGRRDGRADSQGCFELANGGSTQLTVVRASFLCPSLPRGSSMPVVSPYHQPRFCYISLIPPKIHACTPCRRSIGSIAGKRRYTGRWLAGCMEPATAAGPVRCLWNKVGTGALGRRTGLWAGRYVPIWTYRATMTQQPGAERSPGHRLAHLAPGPATNYPRRSSHPSHLLLAMGKSQSKLSPEQLADLQKHTYCACASSRKP